ncbi:MAG TPA: class F sortase [Acidimicrobiales bacterium]
MPRSLTGRRPAPRVLVAGAAALVVAGTVLLGLGLLGGDGSLPRPVPSAAATRGTVTTLPSAVPLSTVRSFPVRLRVPAIGLSVTLTSLGLNGDGTVQVPADDRRPGWFRLGPTPGELGSSVILGHVDNAAGPGVFFTLRTLAAGDPVFVDRADGGSVEFVVDSVATYPRGEFPAQRVYGPHGSSALQLVTCGGAFDHASGSYLSNVVVYTSLIAVSPPRPPAR